MRQLANLGALIKRHERTGNFRADLPGVNLVSSVSPGPRTSAIYEPCFGVVAQGRKRTMVGDMIHEYSGGQYLVVSVDLPLSSQVIEATKSMPYLAMSMPLRPTIIADLLLETELKPADVGRAGGLEVSNVTPELLDPIMRMLRLLDHPKDIPVLLPLIERELMWCLLNGTRASTVRQLATSNSRLSQIARATQWLRTHYARTIRIEQLAQVADMSLPSFNRHFRAITAMSPLQYQKQIRLQEARNRLLTSEKDASTISFEVGYQSPSQFNREYRRFFGAPPLKDVERLRSHLDDIAAQRRISPQHNRAFIT